MILKDLLYNFISQIVSNDISNTPKLDAQLLVCHGLQINSREELFLSRDRILKENEINNCNELLKRRLNNEPIAYIVEKQDFWDNTFKVTKDVLIPRPETELIIEAVLRYFPDRNKDLRILDLGTGSGCIAITLSKLYPSAIVTASDISTQALEIAKVNAMNLGVMHQISFIQSDWFENIQRDSYDVIISNPPYISLDEWSNLLDNVKNYEPTIALTDHNDGLIHYEKIIARAKEYMDITSILILEHGYKQSDSVTEIGSRNQFKSIENIKDLAKILRIAILKL